jgi:hypothetical protein
MKTTRALLLALALILAFGPLRTLAGDTQSGAVPEGFLGVPWGAKSDEIVKAMKERGYRQLKGADAGQLSFKGAFAGEPCQLSFRLMAGSFCSASANFCARSGHPQGPQAAFTNIVRDMSEKYGPPTGRRSDKLKTNDGKTHPQEGAWWDLVDGRTSDKYSISVDFGVTWFADDTGDQYVVNVNYRADSLNERLKKAEY